MRGDIIQDQANGWFYHDNGDGTGDNLSEEGPATLSTLKRPLVLVRNGQPTGQGDRVAVKVATILAARYA